MGTITIVALIPIAVGIASKIGVETALSVGAVVSGAMFGDNLSIISDTTIAATRTQGTYIGKINNGCCKINIYKSKKDLAF